MFGRQPESDSCRLTTSILWPKVYRFTDLPPGPDVATFSFRA